MKGELVGEVMRAWEVKGNDFRGGQREEEGKSRREVNRLLKRTEAAERKVTEMKTRWREGEQITRTTGKGRSTGMAYGIDDKVKSDSEGESEYLCGEDGETGDRGPRNR